MNANTLPIHSFLFNAVEFKIYGTHEEPLFLVNDVVCGLLGMDRPTYNHFFRDNRKNSAYVMLCCFSTAPQDIQSRLKSNQTDSIYFFTEKGLYKCLMRSNVPIAELFQDEICDLLKNIRLSNISIHIHNIEELKRQLAESEEARENAIADYRARVQTLEEEVKVQTDKIDKATEQIHIYELKFETGETYIGKTNDFDRRIRQHSRCSSNGKVRELSRTRSMSVRRIATIPCLSRDDQKYIERNAILAIPVEDRLNRQIPSPDMNRVTVSTLEEEEKVPLNTLENTQDNSDSLSTIHETQSMITLAKINPHAKSDKYLSQFTDSVNRLAAFINSKRTYPQKRSTDEEEAKLGRFVDKIRQQLNNPKYRLEMTDDRRDYLFTTIPDFIQDEKEWHFTQTVKELAAFISTENRYPVSQKGDTRSNEAILAKFLAHLRESNRQANGSHKLTESRISLVEKLIPGFEWNADGYFELRDTIAKLRAFCKEHRRAPRMNQTAGNTEYERVLGCKVHNIKTSLKAQTVKPEVAEAKRLFIQQYAPDILQALVSGNYSQVE